MRLLVILVIPFVVDCAFVPGRWSVAPFGPDTYIATNLDRWTTTAESAQHASGYCEERGKTVLPVRWDGHREFVFRCLDEGDPDLKRPAWDTEPAVRIEDARGSRSEQE